MEDDGEDQWANYDSYAGQDEFMLEQKVEALEAKLLAVAQQAERFRILGDEYAKEGDLIKAAMFHAVAVCLEKAVA